MRNYLLTIIAALCLAPSLASATTIEMQVNGLVCAFCAQGIEKTLRAYPATADVVVSLEKKLVAVALKPDQDISDAQLTQALTNAGYSVKSIQREVESLDAVRARLKANKS